MNNRSVIDNFLHCGDNSLFRLMEFYVKIGCNVKTSTKSITAIFCKRPDQFSNLRITSGKFFMQIRATIYRPIKKSDIAQLLISQ